MGSHMCSVAAGGLFGGKAVVCGNVAIELVEGINRNFNRDRVVGEWGGGKVVGGIVGSVAVGGLIDGTGVGWGNVVIGLVADAVVG